ncbi:hypothetical protein SAMN04487891_102462 [Flagellimonas taeanensis]|uniref:Uncharacterized protein n=1 Tax=Flagellimonas taeanensis TaxID=1005926 RepID=A0A1M6SIL5_9FLAO|nr:hypothetical protein SAMN04487891_102462 [Allomuricauda taeanensis]SHK44469.1 hypothetical protein SAMN05216293_1143 [Allomuricauda taeanensis]
MVYGFWPFRFFFAPCFFTGQTAMGAIGPFPPYPSDRLDHEYSVSLPMIKASVPGKYSRDQQRSPGPLGTSLCPCTQGNDQRNEIIPNKDCGFPYPVKNMAFFSKISTLS